jgi:hypothetical protein
MTLPGVRKVTEFPTVMCRSTPFAVRSASEVTRISHVPSEQAVRFLPSAGSGSGPSGFLVGELVSPVTVPGLQPGAHCSARSYAAASRGSFFVSAGRRGEYAGDQDIQNRSGCPQ